MHAHANAHALPSTSHHASKRRQNRCCPDYNSRTSIPSGGFLILWLQSSVAGTVVFFVSGAKGGLCSSCLTPGSPLASAGAQTGNTSTRQVPTLSRASESSAG